MDSYWTQRVSSEPVSGGGEGVGVGALFVADLPEEPGRVTVTSLGSLVGEARVHGLRLVGLPGDRVRQIGPVAADQTGQNGFASEVLPQLDLCGSPEELGDRRVTGLLSVIGIQVVLCVGERLAVHRRPPRDRRLPGRGGGEGHGHRPRRPSSAQPDPLDIAGDPLTWRSDPPAMPGQGVSGDIQRVWLGTAWAARSMSVSFTTAAT